MIILYKHGVYTLIYRSKLHVNLNFTSLLKDNPVEHLLIAIQLL